ncbi:hypothetical protein [Actinotalea sp. K2]|uniref:hypothetical protein n=1 Tax=Actinotalea sp. K2 TaxID=2939438 RepID=UPI0020171216|nr:hypothetical protein [Actinotalea sp. K2]MCL3859921.1 hypothetical protein [Actinotalea sp. K2]
MRLTFALRLARARCDAERGIGTIEYLGIVVLAALLVAAVVLGVSATQYGPRVAQALCEIVSLGQGSCGEVTTQERAPEDYVPPEPCVINADGAGWDAAVAIAVQVEGGQTWLYEQLDDGRVRLTRTDEAAAGAEVGVGFDVSLTLDDERYGASLSAGAAAMVTGQEGDVFYAADRAAAEAILSAQRTSDVKDVILGDGSLARQGWDWATEQLGGSTRYEDLAPDETFTRAGIQLSGSANATLIDGSAGVELEMGVYEGRVDRTDGTSTDIFTASASGSAEGGKWLSSVEGYGVATASFEGSLRWEVDRDARGEAVAVRVVTTGMAHADAYGKNIDEGTNPSFTETTVQVPLTSDADRLVAGRLAQSLGLEVDGVTDNLSLLDRPGNTVFMAQNVEDFTSLARDTGYVYQQHYEVDTTEYGANLDAKYILEAGLGGSYTAVQRTATGYRYWNGQNLVDRTGCVAQ